MYFLSISGKILSSVLLPNYNRVGDSSGRIIRSFVDYPADTLHFNWFSLMSVLITSKYRNLQKMDPSSKIHPPSIF